MRSRRRPTPHRRRTRGFGRRAFVDKLRSADDKSNPALHDKAVVHLNAVFKYAAVQGRGQLLQEMKIPGAWREAQRAYETGLKGGSEDECPAPPPTPGSTHLRRSWDRYQRGSPVHPGLDRAKI